MLDNLEGFSASTHFRLATIGAAGAVFMTLCSAWLFKDGPFFATLVGLGAMVMAAQTVREVESGVKKYIKTLKPQI